MATFVNDMCLALEQTASADNQLRQQAEGFIKEVSAHKKDITLLSG